MIFLDTNILKSVSLRGADGELLRVLREAKAERVATAEMVMVELAAQEAIRYEKKARAAQEAMEDLRRASPWRETPPVEVGSADDARRYWRAQYEKVVDTIKPSIEVHEEGLYREVNVLPPCKLIGEGRAQAKTGVRDAVIWLTAVEYARQHPEETVRFVSEDKDFRRTTTTGRSLLDDLEGMEDRFFMHSTLGEVMTEFARRTSVTEEQVSTLLASRAGLEDLRGPARARLDAHARVGRGRRLLNPQNRASLDVRLSLAEVTDPLAYEIDGHIWYVADARWAVAYPIIPSAGFTVQSWKTRVMVSEDSGASGVTLLKNSPFQSPESGDEERFSELAGLFLQTEDLDGLRRITAGASFLETFLREEGGKRLRDLTFDYPSRAEMVDAIDAADFDIVVRDMAEAHDFRPEGPDGLPDYFEPDDL